MCSLCTYKQGREDCGKVDIVGKRYRAKCSGENSRFAWRWGVEEKEGEKKNCNNHIYTPHNLRRATSAQSELKPTRDSISPPRALPPTPKPAIYNRSCDPSLLSPSSIPSHLPSAIPNNNRRFKNQFCKQSASLVMPLQSLHHSPYFLYKSIL